MLVALAVIHLSSADICAEPQSGPGSEPEYCLVSEPTVITTPHFSIDIPAGYYVGLNVSGRQMYVFDDLEQRNAGATILVLPAIELQFFDKSILEECGEIAVPEIGEVECDHSSENSIAKVRFIKTKHRLVWIQYGVRKQFKGMWNAIENLESSIVVATD